MVSGVGKNTQRGGAIGGEFYSVVFLSVSYTVRRAAAAAEKWPCLEKGLIEVLAVQPRATTLIETEARDPSCQHLG